MNAGRMQIKQKQKITIFHGLVLMEIFFYSTELCIEFLELLPEWIKTMSYNPVAVYVIWNSEFASAILQE